MSQWLTKKSTLADFPFEVLGHTSRDGQGGSSRKALQACAHVAVPLAVVQVGEIHGGVGPCVSLDDDRSPDGRGSSRAE